MESFTSNLFPLDFALRILVALERDSVETEGALLVDHTPTIKLVRTYENKISIQFQSSIKKQRTLGSQVFFITISLTTFS